MKVYISGDIEGVTGVTVWPETEKQSATYQAFAEQMTNEVNAACRGALNAGAKEIVVKDAHDTGRNMDGKSLPVNVRLIRGWSGHPFFMVQELDESFDAVIFIGYHSCSGSSANPLSHTMSASGVNYIKINGWLASEFLINTYAAASVNVPVVFVSGDQGLCNDVKEINSNIEVVPVKEGIGSSTTSIHPQLAVDLIEQRVENALMEKRDRCWVDLPKDFHVEISFVDHSKAYRASFYPGMKQISPRQVIFHCNDYFDVLRMIMFVV